MSNFFVTVKKFTLIELLTVIIIISILMCLLLPVLVQAKERAKIVICLGNQKQITSAMHIYSSDHDRMLVYTKWYTDFAGKRGRHGWSPNPATHPRLLNPYLGGDDSSSELVKCPSDKGDSLYPSWKSTYVELGNSYSVQYASFQHNGVGFSTNSAWDGSGLMKRKITWFTNPSYKISLHSNEWGNNRDWYSDKTRWHGQSITRPYIPASFMDGHVENFYVTWRTLPRGSPNFSGRSSSWLIANYGYY